MRMLREFIRTILKEEVDQNPDPENGDKKDPPEDLLIEPDMHSEDEESQKEASAVAAGGAPSGKIRGSTSPLGADATYPSKKKKKNGKSLARGGDSNWYLPKKR